jgi:hypothetical protein
MAESMSGFLRVASALTTDGAPPPNQRPSWIAIWRRGNGQLDVDLLDVTELAGDDELTEPPIHRMVQVVEAFHNLT